MTRTCFHPVVFRSLSLNTESARVVDKMVQNMDESPPEKVTAGKVGNVDSWFIISRSLVH